MLARNLNRTYPLKVAKERMLEGSTATQRFLYYLKIFGF
jgi:hypothetical protein